MLMKRFLSTAFPLGLPAIAQEMADRIFISGPVLTMNEAQC